MDLQLENKVVLITGGSKGIGKAIAKAFKQEGAIVAIVARSAEDLEATKTELDLDACFQADLSVSKERDHVLKKIVNDLGQIDILVNNVGGSNGGTTMETDVELFEAAMNLNFFSTVHLSKLAATNMKACGQGTIINISSIFGRESGGKPTYNSAKAALISFTKSFADEVIQDGIRVNGIAPGSIIHPTGNWQKRLEENPAKINAFVENEIPAGRFGTVEEVANVALFLASDKASWVVGATLNVDGGQSRANF